MGYKWHCGMLCCDLNEIFFDVYSNHDCVTFMLNALYNIHFITFNVFSLLPEMPKLDINMTFSGPITVVDIWKVISL